MINLTVEKIIEQSGSTRFKLTPASFTIGGVDANYVDEISVALPDEWSDKSVRVYFVPANSAPFHLLYDGTPLKVSANMTKVAGAIVVDAILGDYHAYTTNANYKAYTHLVPTGEEEPEYTPSQIEQFLAYAQAYANVAKTARDEAIVAKVTAVDKARQTAEDRRRTGEDRQVVEELVNGFDGYVEDKISEFNLNAAQETDAFVLNATEKTYAFNANVTAKTSGFNTAVGEATDAFNANATAKGNAFDLNVTQKTNDFNSNFSGKIESFNDNAQDKTEEFNAAVEEKIGDLPEVKAELERIDSLIPEQASEENQLADKDFVNSSIATNTADFIGTFNSVAELQAYTGIKTNNDYAFVVTNDETTGFVKQYDRYKWTGTQWLFEYTLNNSSFTAQQWATINSGVTAEGFENKVDKEDGKSLVSDAEIERLANVDNYDDTEIRALINGKVDKETGKGLSTNDFTDAEKNKLAGLENYDDTEVRSLINSKVDKVAGKGLSENDYTTPEKNKLAGLENYNDTAIWEKINSIEGSKFPNVAIFGTPIFNQGQVSGFSSSNYLQFPFIVDFKNKPFELDFEITTGAEVTQQHNVFDSEFGLAFAVRNSRFVVAISTNGTSWNVGEGIGTHAVLPNRTYQIKIIWNGVDTFELLYSDNGETYISDIVKPLTTQPYPKQMLIGVTSDKSTFFNGTINLNTAKLTVANLVVWVGMGTIDGASKADINLANIDTAGKDKIKTVALETAVSFEEQTLTDDQKQQARENISASSANEVSTLKQQIKDLIVSSFDGTAEKYHQLMNGWLLSNGILAMSPVGITSLLNEWYDFTRTGWNGGTEFAQPDVTAVSTGTRVGDNAGMSCTPSTDTVKNRDDFAGLPLFAITDCNWTLDETGEWLVTAVDGIHSGFERNNPAKLVGVMQQTPYHWYDETATTYTHGMSDRFVSGHNYCQPVPEAVRLDGTVRNFVVHGKYMMGNNNNRPTCCAGFIPWAWKSHDNTISNIRSTLGNNYSGGTLLDWSWLVLHTMIKYASMTLDGIIQGCVSYNFQYTRAVSENNVKRILLTTSQGNNIRLNSSVFLGTNTSGTDRGVGAVYSITGQLGAEVVNIEDVEISGTTYKAIYVNTPNTFNTTVGTTLLSTFHWKTGTNDTVLGNDGSIVSASNGVYPAKLQGIEFMNGSWEVFTDCFMNKDGSKYTAYRTNKASTQTSSITSNYKNIGMNIPTPASSNWYYIKKLGFANNVFFQEIVGGSSSTYTRDTFYLQTGADWQGLREWLAFGDLGHGSGRAGLSCHFGASGLGHAAWAVGARLSPNGTVGEFVA